MGGGAADPGQVPGGGTPGDLGLVHEPRPGTVVTVGGIALRSGERAQDLGPRRGLDRIQLLQLLQTLRLRLGRHLGGTRAQVAQHRAEHP